MITIFTISYNSAAVIQQCMDDLMRSQKYRIIVVDNASRDGSVKTLRESYPHVEIVELTQNIGYGRAANVALKQISTPYALLINPDLLVSVEDVDKLLMIAEQYKDKAALIGPAVKEEDYLQQGMVEREWIIGAAMLFSMKKLAKIGYFDEEIFLFYEEKDICKRFLDTGEKIYLNSDLYIEHLGGQSSKPNLAIEYMKNWHVGWSSAYFFKKHNLDSGRRSALALLARHFIKAFFSLNAAKRSKFKPRLIGVLAHLKGQRAFLSDGTPQVNPSNPKNPFCSTHE